MSILSVKIAAKLSGAASASGSRHNFPPGAERVRLRRPRGAAAKSGARGERAGAREAAESGARSAGRLRFAPQRSIIGTAAML